VSGHCVRTMIDECPVCHREAVEITATFSAGEPRTFWHPGEGPQFEDVECEHGCQIDPEDPAVDGPLWREVER